LQPDLYTRLSLAILRGDKATARQIYYDEILPDRGFSRGEVTRLSYRLGAIDEGDQYLANGADLGARASSVGAERPRTAARRAVLADHLASAAGAGCQTAGVPSRPDAEPATPENGVRRNRVEKVEAMLIPGEVIEAVFDTRGGCTGFVGITSRRLIIHDRAFLHRHRATVSIPYSQISSIAAKDDAGRFTGRGGWASSELILTTGAGDFELEFRGAEKAHQAYCLIVQHLV
jgi:hypothetical protein